MASPWTVLLFGKSGSYKTSELRHIARRVYEKHGKITRLVSSDGGGWTPLQDYIDAGIIDPWRVSMIEQPLSVYRKLAKGYWPNVVTQNGARRLALVEPTADTWNKVGAYLVEGFTSIALSLMRDHLSKQRVVAGDQTGKGEVIKFDEKVLVQLANGSLTEELEKFMFPTRGHYNSVQQSLYEIVTSFSSLPVHMVGFTALESVGEERLSTGERPIKGRTVFGPLLIGQAMTAASPAWVGDCIHLDSYSEDIIVERKDERGQVQKVKAGERMKVRAYYVQHPDLETGIPVLAKPRVPASKWPDLVKTFAGGFYESTPGPDGHGLDLYLDAEERLISESAESLRQWKRQVDSARLDKTKEVAR